MTVSRATIDATAAGAPRISFIVLNWRNAPATRACLASIDGQLESAGQEIILVDNDSTPASRAALADGPWTLVCLEGNHGFTGGMNAGAAHARGDFIALVNNDARLGSDWSTRALAAAAPPNVGIVGGRSLSEDPRDTGSTLPRIDPRGLSQLLSVDIRRSDVAAVDGGHLLIRAAAWRDVGGLDNDFFAYYEELDLCARTLARGWRVVYDPSVRVWHQRGLSSDRVRWRRRYWARRNRTIWLAEHFPAGEWRSAVLAAALEYLTAALCGEVEVEAPLRARLTARSASFAAFCWVVSHGRWLHGKRRATIARGLHDPGYRRRLEQLYEPSPFAPGLLDPHLPA
jgi:GT2 family glycosyltransferase